MKNTNNLSKEYVDETIAAGKSYPTSQDKNKLID